MKIFTSLQSLYWQKQDLHDTAWRIERQIVSLKKRGKNAPKLLQKYVGIIEEISSIELQMAKLENATV